MGLPLLTLSGKSFVSRMGGSLLTAAGVPELITCNLPDYESKAIYLAKNRQTLGEFTTTRIETDAATTESGVQRS
jgi:predicted O-linked N-acetylglucosamine transferase (SPINDLY family)